MDINELQSYRLADAVKFNDQLNPRLWGSDEHLLPEVRDKLMAIADDFREFLGITDLDIRDITISGSNAAYTYTPHSDIDLHLVVDLPKADISEVYRELFDAKKYAYNDQHDYKIGGYDVELYVQNANEPHYSQGIYSIKDDEWKSVPRRRKPEIDDISVKSKYEDLGHRIEAAIRSGELDKMDAVARKVKDLRGAGLEKTGEFGPENLAFKILRNNGTLEKLRNARLAAKDARMSLDERKKKKRKARRRYGSFGGMWFPGYGYYGDTGSAEAADGGGDGGGGDGGGGESVKESAEPQDTESILRKFIEFTAGQVGIESMPHIRFKRDPAWSERNNTFGRYVPEENTLYVSLANRHPMDIMRTVAHELTHHRQNEISPMPIDSGDTGSDWENEANAAAGIIMRRFSDLHPELFHGTDINETDTGQNPQPGRPIDWPEGTVHVKVSDVYDWYKLGQKLSNLDSAKKGEFGTGVPETILVFNNEPQEEDMIDTLEKLGLDVHDVDPGEVPGQEQHSDVDESLRGRLGAAAAAACIAGTPGCATTDTLKTVQTVGRTAQTFKGMKPGDAREELTTAVKDALRKGTGTRESEEFKPNLNDPIVNYDIPYTAIARPERLWQVRRYGQVSHYKSPTSGMAIISVPVSKERNFVDAMRNQGIQVKKSQVYEASGYIPTEKERNDPRFSMALTVDVHPGQTGKEANKLGLETDSQGRPQLLMKKLSNLLEATKQNIPIGAVLDLRPNYPKYKKLLARVDSVLANGKVQLTVIDSEGPGQAQIGTRISIAPNYLQKASVVQEACWDGYRQQVMKDQGNRMVPVNNDISEAAPGGIGWSHDPKDIEKIRAWSREKAETQSRTFQGHTIKFTPDGLLIYRGGDLVFQRTGDFSNPTNQDVMSAKATITRLINKAITESEDQDLMEVKMSPGELQRWAQSPEAEGIQAGFEAELIFRNAQRDGDGESEPDYDQDQRAYSIEGIIDFFEGGDNGITSRTASRLRDGLYDEWYNWQVEQIDAEWDKQEEELVEKWMRENVWNEDTYRERAAEDLGIETSEESADRAEDIRQRAEELFQEDVEESIRKKYSSDNWQEAYTEFSDEMREDSDLDEEAFLRDAYRYMSDIQNAFELDWPYWTDGGYGEGRSVEEIADSLSEALDGARVVGSSGYHSVKRRPGQWIIEPDGSLDPDDYEDAGLEVVSPPMPLPEALAALKKVTDWANGSGDAYTNNSTGLHMGVSIPHKGGDVDYVKLILFLGDKYILEKFGRAANSYTRSALSKLQDVQRSRREGVREADEPLRMAQMRGTDKTAAAMDLMRKNLIELAQKYVQDGVGKDKYTSAHIKPGYIEFRSPGGDYLDMNDTDENALANTMLRFARAMYIAGRPDLERKEYAKKLYQLIDSQGNDGLKLFMDYTTGKIDREELKKDWARQVLAKEQPEKTAQDYEVYDKATGETLEVLSIARKEEHEPQTSRLIADTITKYDDQGIKIGFRKVDEPEAEPSRRAKVAKNIVGRPTVWHVENTATGKVLLVAAANTRAAERQAQQMDPEFDRLVRDESDNLFVAPASPEEIKQYQQQQTDNKQDSGQLQSRLQGTGGRRWRVEWTERQHGRIVNDAYTVEADNGADAMDKIRRTLGYQGREAISMSVNPAPLVGSTLDRAQQRADAASPFNTVVIYNPRTGQEFETFSGTDYAIAQRVMDVEREQGVGHGLFRYRPAEQEQQTTPSAAGQQDADEENYNANKYEIVNDATGEVVETFWAGADQLALNVFTQWRRGRTGQYRVRAARPGAAATPAQTQGEFTGSWQIKDPTGQVIHIFGGIGNSQADANRYAAGWLGRHRPDLAGQEVDVVPEMR